MAAQLSPKVLWADDEVYQTNLLADVLRCEGVDVVGAKDATAAKRMLTTQAGEFSLVIVDVMMPPGEEFENLTAVQGGYRSGLLLARWIRSTYPTLPVIGYSLDHSPDVAEWFETETAGFYHKGVTRWSIVETIKQLARGSKIQPKIFIVHGHDDGSKLALKDYLQNTLGLGMPVILHEQPSLGRTIIEKFEAQAEDVDMVFVLLTPDDLLQSGDASKYRGRQNVIFELGYFYGRLKRNRGKVILLVKGHVEIPSDLAGIVYIDISNGMLAAGEEIRRELERWLPRP